MASSWLCTGTMRRYVAQLLPMHSKMSPCADAVKITIDRF